MTEFAIQCPRCHCYVAPADGLEKQTAGETPTEPEQPASTRKWQKARAQALNPNTIYAYPRWQTIWTMWILSVFSWTAGVIVNPAIGMAIDTIPLVLAVSLCFSRSTTDRANGGAKLVLEGIRFLIAVGIIISAFQAARVY